MSMDHKAYPFDHDGFTAELAPVLYRALETDDPAGLVAFIGAERERLTDPYEGEPLGPDWAQELGGPWDVHQYGRVALTAYFDVLDDDGLHELWELALDNFANDVPGDPRELVLGTPFGPAHNRFDPGKFGSYFRSAERARSDLAAIDAVIATGIYSDTVELMGNLLRKAVDVGRGLYVTF